MMTTLLCRLAQDCKCVRRSTNWAQLRHGVPTWRDFFGRRNQTIRSMAKSQTAQSIWLGFVAGCALAPVLGAVGRQFSWLKEMFPFKQLDSIALLRKNPMSAYRLNGGD